MQQTRQNIADTYNRIYGFIPPHNILGMKEMDDRNFT
jgi:hypothetical protein